MKAKILWALLLLSFEVQAGLLFTYHQLALKDLDQMSNLVNSKIKGAKKSSSGKHVPLKEAYQAVMSRPDVDGMVAKVVTPLKTELEVLNVWEKTVSDLTTEAINALKNPNNFKPDVQVTYAVFLENMIAELKPDIGTEGFERRLMEKIRDARLEFTKEAQNERKLRMMKSPISPSEIANTLLKSTKVEKKVTPAPAPEPAPAPLEGFFEE